MSDTVNYKNILLVQARMGSSRFPRKMSREFGNDVLLGYVLQNLLSWILVDEIILATSTAVADDELELIASKKGIRVYRGDENNVAERLVGAGLLFENDLQYSRFFRVCADNPFLCEDLFVEQVLFLQNHNNIDYLSHRIEQNPVILTDFGIFIEYFNMDFLAESLDDLSNTEQEHATMRFLKSETNSKTDFLDFKLKLDPRVRLTCDTKEDYKLLRGLTGKLSFPITTSQIENLVSGLSDEVFKSMEEQRNKNSKK